MSAIRYHPEKIKARKNEAIGIIRPFLGLFSTEN
jgi:hypothetical protein